jgi:hypothetical protein
MAAAAAAAARRGLERTPGLRRGGRNGLGLDVGGFAGGFAACAVISEAETVRRAVCCASGDPPLLLLGGRERVAPRLRAPLISAMG